MIPPPNLPSVPPADFDNSGRVEGYTDIRFLGAGDGGVVSAPGGHRLIAMRYTFANFDYATDERVISLLYDADSGTYSEVFNLLEVEKPTGLNRSHIVDIGLF
jgi:hypothetical protein